MRVLEHSIDIAAEPDAVWRILADTAGYAAWNPFLVEAAGAFTPGDRLAFTMRPGDRTMRFAPTVLEVADGRRVRWLGRLLLPGVFDGEHELEVRPVGPGLTRFTQRERFSGLLVPLLGSLLRATDAGFAAMNRALKVRAEAGAR